MKSENSYSKSDIEHDVVAVDQVDVAAQLSTGQAIDPQEATRVQKKIDKHIIPLMCSALF
jgi:hypothetical protein